MTRKRFMVEVEWETSHTLEEVREHLEMVLATYSFLAYHNPTVELITHEPVPQYALGTIDLSNSLLQAKALFGSKLQELQLTTADALESLLEENAFDDWVLRELVVQPEVYEITTVHSKYRIELYQDGTGHITRLGGSSPYVPPEIAGRAWDGISYSFKNGRFEAYSWDKTFEQFVCDGYISRTTYITEKKLIS